MKTHFLNSSKLDEFTSFHPRKNFWTFVATVLFLLFLVASPPLGAVPTEGRILWLDASTLELEDGARVAEWPDLSGSGYHAVQEDPARRPVFVESGSIFGLPVIRFTGASPFQHLLVQDMGPYWTPYTIFLVWKINQSTGGDQNALDGLTEAERVRIGYQASPGRLFAFSGGSFPNLQKLMPVPFDNLIMTAVVYDSFGGLLRVNGELEDENVTGETPITGFIIGRRTTTEAQNLVGDIAELIVYDRPLTEAEIEEVEAYLDGKWLRDLGDTTPPTVPQNLTATAGAAFVHLTWEPSTDDSGNVIYHVERDGELFPASVSDNSYVDQTVLPNTTYTYRVRAADLSGNISEFGNSVEATTTSLALARGVVLAEFYTGLPGVLVDQLREAENFPDSPDQIQVWSALESPFTDWGSDYGGRVSGWFIPPQSGDYVFFLAADDQAEFFLSTDDSPANLRLIAQEPVWNNYRDWTGLERRDQTGFPENRSDTYWFTEWPEQDHETGGALITLEAGQRHYFEGLWKEEGGGDHFAVTFKLKEEPDPAPGTPTRIRGDMIESLGDPGFIAPTIVAHPQSRAAALGQSVTLSVEVAEVSSEPLTYQWFLNGDEIPGATGASYTIPSFQAAHDGVYSVVVSNVAGTAASRPAFLRIPGQTLVEQGLVLRLDASALELQDGAPVSSWTDLSGAGNHAVQEDESARPILVAEGSPSGLPVVRFSAVSPYPHLLVQDMGPHDPPNTAFLVWKVNQSTGADQNAFDGLADETRVRIGHQASPARVFAHAGGSFPDLQKLMAVPFEDFILTSVVYDPEGGLLRVDGLLEHENTTGETPISGFTIGRRLTEAQPLAGDIAELIIYDRRLSQSEIAQVESYLQVKWFTDESVEPPPPGVTLSAAISEGQLLLSWPASAEGFALHQTSSLTPPIDWSPVAAEVIEQNGINTVRIEMTAESQYFQLVQ